MKTETYGNDLKIKLWDGLPWIYEDGKRISLVVENYKGVPMTIRVTDDDVIFSPQNGFLGILYRDWKRINK